VAGDGTTSVTVICGALLKKCQELLEKGVHPTIISDSFNKAANKACEVRRRRRPAAAAQPARSPARRTSHGPPCPQILESFAIPVNLDDRESLIKAANT
jgi:T-complex protein 1 subunit delta